MRLTGLAKLSFAALLSLSLLFLVERREALAFLTPLAVTFIDQRMPIRASNAAWHLGARHLRGQARLWRRPRVLVTIAVIVEFPPRQFQVAHQRKQPVRPTARRETIHAARGLLDVLQPIADAARGVMVDVRHASIQCRNASKNANQPLDAIRIDLGKLGRQGIELTLSRLVMSPPRNFILPRARLLESVAQLR